MSFLALILTLLVGMFILVGVVFGLKNKNNKKFQDLTISIAFGVIITLVLLELIPETFEVLNESIGVGRSVAAIIILILIGIVVLKILDLFIPHHEHEAHHEHEHKNDKCHKEHLLHIGIISSIALVLHNLIEGMSLFMVAKNNFSSGLLLCIGIGLHNIPMGLVIASTLTNSKYTKEKILKIGLGVSLSTFIGGLLILILGNTNEILEGVLLGLTAGMLIYISIFELLHQMIHMKEKYLPKVGAFIGVALLVISVFIEKII